MATRKVLSIAGLVLVCAAGAQAVTMEWVTVGDPGNVNDTHGYGGVGYVYNIGRYEVTNAQYCAFLNAVAASDPHGLYNTYMGTFLGGITRSGSSPNYTYSTIAGRGNMPVNHVSWYDTLRFANWMHNGATAGADTEDGAYDMSLGASVVRKPGALVFLPSEDEWYKAAYYKGGGISAGYWDYPTRSDNAPTAEGPPGTDLIKGSANYRYALYDLTDVGAYTYKPSDSAYNTFDQGGNVWEWNETHIYYLDVSYRGLRGGSFRNSADRLHASGRYYDSPSREHDIVGFRVAEVPEPATLSVLSLGALALIRRR